ncbi:MAG TPA: ATP-binding protein, partial [Chloroflexota bacterium]|nr:ATP-binding protein [Chloroflexota bacterium]
MAGAVVQAPAGAYRRRWADSYLEELFAELPALLITGPRATGKTTTARRLVATEVNLDQPAQALAFRADPDAALRALPEPILLDEWQEVPDILGAVKRAVDLDSKRGRFLLTGSVRADLQTTTWPGTGRLVRVHMFGLTVKECQQTSAPLGRPLLDRLAAGQLTDIPMPRPAPDLVGYVELLLQSGFPEPALRLSRQRTRTAWLEGYLEQLFTRDAQTLLDVRDPARLRRYFEALALDQTGLAAHNTLYEAATINRRTAVAY